MYTTVNAYVDACIRNDIIVLVGSAGDTCDDIGADVYTEDVGETAKMALEVLSARKHI